MNLIRVLAMAIVAITVMSFAIAAGSWNIDPNYSIKFSGKKAEGTFSGLKGTILYNPNDLEHSKIDVTVDANTIKTGNDTKDGHAKGDSWFDTEKYPTVKFSSSSFAKAGDKVIVSGTMELHGVKNPVQIPFKFSEANNKGIFAGQFTINRKQFGIKGNSMGFMVGDDFEISLNIPVTPQK